MITILRTASSNVRWMFWVCLSAEGALISWRILVAMLADGDAGDCVHPTLNLEFFYAHDSE